MMPPGGLGVAAVIWANRRACEFAQALWPLMSVRTTGLLGAARSRNSLLGGVAPKEAASHCPPVIHSPLECLAAHACTAFWTTVGPEPCGKRQASSERPAPMGCTC